MENLEDALNAFTLNLERLKDWPDKIIIMELTAITEKNINFAFHFANIIIARLVDDRTHTSYKLPVFYLIDSVMKHVGGPFAALFGKHLSDQYVIAVRNLHEKDRKHLDFLLGTWEERKLLPGDLIAKMKHLLSKLTAVTSSNVCFLCLH